MERFDWDDLRFFLAVARSGRLTAAARRLGADHATVSRRITSLEEALKAKLFGGAKIAANLRDIGASNAEFARGFLRTEGISCVAESLGGNQARRVTFHPATGRARQLLIPNDQVDETTLRKPPPRPAPATSIELF